MEEARVKDLMVAVADYATVSENTTLARAMVALEEAQERHRQRRSKYQHRGLLVSDASGKTVGKLSMIDVLRALVPGPAKGSAMNRLGFSRDFIDTAAEKFEGLHGSLAAMCARVAGTRVGEIMTVPEPGEYVDEEADLETAIHQLVRGKHQSLLVTRGGHVVGILRLADVFHAAFEALSDCG